jgi:uncharacterized damage-inducible protein DinB
MRRLLALLAVSATSLSAQVSGSGGAVAASRELWKEAHNYVLKTAEQLPDSLFGFKPTPAVRSFGDLLGHVAGSEFMFCSAVLGDKARAEDDIEKTAKTKAALVKAIKDAGTYCDKAYAITDAASTAPMGMFGGKGTKFYYLNMNTTHDWEHYGNLVTYLRLKGITPPSSQ